jgi:hypothetical protein
MKDSTSKTVQAVASAVAAIAGLVTAMLKESIPHGGYVAAALLVIAGALLAVIVGYHVHSFFRGRQRSDLENHSVFVKMGMMKSVEIYAIEVPPNRVVFLDMLWVAVNSLDCKLRCFVEDYRGKSFSSQEELMTFVFACFAEAISETDREYTRNGIPYEVVASFRKWNNDKTLMLRQLVEELFQMEGMSNDQIVDLILTNFGVYLRAMVTNAKTAVASLNGTLRGVKYRRTLHLPPGRSEDIDL